MKQTTLQIIFNILLFIAILVMLFLTITLMKNINLIKSDPFLYSMSIHNFSSCTCIGNEGMVTIDDKGRILNNNQGIKMNLLNITLTK